MKATVIVKLKADVLDPQGKAIQHACGALGFEGVSEVRQGKYFEVTLEDRPGTSPTRLLEELCEKLLANPVIEDYQVESKG